MLGEPAVCAGIDWAKDTHEVLVCDADGERLWSAAIAHDEAGITRLCQALTKLEVTRVAIERPDGLLIERLLDAGLTVLAIHPNKVAASRDRFRPAGKSDRFDAFVLCELARTDSHRFPALTPDSDQTKALRALTRGLGEKRLAQFLARNRYSGRRSTAELLARLRDAPTGRAGEIESDARRGLVLALVAALKPIVKQIRLLTSEIAHAIHTHPDGEIFLSFFKDPKSVICAATLLAEIGDSRARYPTADRLAAHAGMAPVAVESGRKKVACFRHGCDHRLRDATSTLADATRHRHPCAQDHYALARGRGHDHPRAIRTVGRAWTRVRWRCWQDRVPYDPAKHRGLQQHITVTIPSSSGPRPDLTATQRMAGAAVTEPAAHKAKREALDGKPTSATPKKG